MQLKLLYSLFFYTCCEFAWQGLGSGGAMEKLWEASPMFDKARASCL